MPEVRTTSDGGGALLVCLPPSGAGRSFFRQWPRQVGGAPVVALSRPGHEERVRESFAHSVLDVAADVVNRIVARRPARVVLFGHSFGATVAFEAVRLLESHVIGTALVASARQAPHLVSVAAKGATAADDRSLLSMLSGWGGVEVSDPDDPLAEMLLPCVRADFTLSATYTWDRWPTSAPLTSISYRDDRVVDESSVRAWAQAAGGRYSHVTEPGDHFAARVPSDTLIGILGEVLAADAAGPGVRAIDD
jgi:pyochelin biosynthesis protein PchC